jgi:hypothetical protein
MDPTSDMGAKERELFHICGDVPDPSGQSGAMGYQSKIDLSKSKFGEPSIFYRDRAGREFDLTADVYKFEGAPLEIVLLCPRCSTEKTPHALKISSDHKRIEYDPRELVGRGGRLNVERIKCTWEIDGTKAVALVGSSLNLCNWHVVIENNVARDV